MPKNPNPFAGTVRCGARTRAGIPCQGLAVRQTGRCRMHGGGGSGAPAGNRNALKDGFYRAKAKARRRAMNAFIRDMTEQIARFEELTYRDSTLPRFRPPKLYDPDYEPPSGQ